jgi:hypothetical protein
MKFKMELGKIGCECGRQMKLIQDCVQWQALVTVMLNLQVLLSGHVINL